MITENIGKLLDTAGIGLGKAFAKFGIGRELHEMSKKIANIAGWKHITVVLRSNDIDNGTVTLTASDDIVAVGSVTAVGSDGTVRAVTKAVVSDGELTLTITNVAVGDTVAVMVYVPVWL